jgi:hypothetical protein
MYIVMLGAIGCVFVEQNYINRTVQAKAKRLFDKTVCVIAGYKTHARYPLSSFSPLHWTFCPELPDRAPLTNQEPP